MINVTYTQYRLMLREAARGRHSSPLLHESSVSSGQASQVRRPQPACANEDVKWKEILRLVSLCVYHWMLLHKLLWLSLSLRLQSTMIEPLDYGATSWEDRPQTTWDDSVTRMKHITYSWAGSEGHTSLWWSAASVTMRLTSEWGDDFKIVYVLWHIMLECRHLYRGEKVMKAWEGNKILDCTLTFWTWTTPLCPHPPESGQKSHDTSMVTWATDVAYKRN